MTILLLIKKKLISNHKTVNKLKFYASLCIMLLIMTIIIKFLILLTNKKQHNIFIIFINRYTYSILIIENKYFFLNFKLQIKKMYLQ